MGSGANLKLRAQVGLVSGLLMSAFFFYFDVKQPLGVAAGISYIAVVAIGLVAQSRFLVALFGVLGTALTIVGFFTSHPESNVSAGIVLLNRGLSLFALMTITITGYLLIKRQEKFDARLIELASTDSLTGLLNRRTLMSEAERRVEEARRYGQPLSVLMLDIDNFKGINDGFGHLAGDKVLADVADVAARCCRRTDYLGRYGGEEFMAICPGVDAREAGVLAERIRSTTASLRMGDGLSGQKVTVSIGVAEMVKPEASVKDLVGAADRCLYKAKDLGKNQVVIDDEDDAPLLDSLP